MKHDLRLLEELTSIPGPAGCESQIQEYFMELLAPFSDEQYVDKVGNTYSEIKGNIDRRIVFTAHCDTVGFMVRYIDDQGFVFTEDIGGSEDPGMVDRRTLPGTRVSIMSRHNKNLVPGQMIPAVPYHLVKDLLDEEMNQTRHEVPIDIGMSTFEAAQRLVDIGDYVIFRHAFEKLGQRISGTYLDDRLCLYVLYRLAQWYATARLRHKPTLVLCTTVCEESRLNTASLVATVAKPDFCLTLDVMPASDSIVTDADFEVYKKHGKFRLNDGPVIARGLGVTEDVFAALEKVCAKNKLSYQIELAKGDTDNHVIHSAGAMTGLIMIPVRNAHTPIEMCELNDVTTTIRLCQSFIKQC